MSDIDALQGRIMAALERIGRGVDALTEPPDGNAADIGADTSASPDTNAADAEALEEERQANAQLEERVKLLNERNRKMETRLTRAKESRESREEALRQAESDLQALRQANQQLRDNNQALREANASGVVDADMINQSMMVELAALRAAQAGDSAEVKLVLSELDQVLNEAGGSDSDAPDPAAERKAKQGDDAAPEDAPEDAPQKEDV